MKQPRLPHSIVIRDTTLREGLDVPGVERRLKFRDCVRLARAIYELGVREFDIVHPGRVGPSSVRLARELKRLYGDKIIVHGAAYAYNEKLDRELALMRDSVDEIDLVMPVIRERKPHTNKEKSAWMRRGLERLQGINKKGGVGFANASQCDRALLIRFSREAAAAGADKIIIYDSVGLWDPLETYACVRQIKAAVPKTPVLFHCHNDLGLAVANSVLAVYGGAQYIDATVNGIGDRAGNAALEQLATIFHIKRVRTGIRLKTMRAVSDLTETLTGIKRAVNHPITGDRRILFTHISPKHIPDKKAFEILPKELIGR